MTILGSIILGFSGSYIWSLKLSHKKEKEIAEKILDEDKIENVQASDTVTNKEEIIIQAKEKFSKGITKLDEASQKLSELINNGKDKIFSDLNSIYDYLNSLTLLEESALFHTLVVLVILIIIFNILR